ncbi:unnamed protein product [Kuraishia capsulata CBS 1993]|uniref:non-specific serine/threonine protein kinase n=1 Tax=Kuraishia capsulata CBS 1993 TaxID=1382522 RepID=W6MJT6_9ASCO|nr:uncharacterized protein KUCA_T00000758001 [Kuraishia capsulata CBS 1993]CDK24792.1 unnamed protein product [Kuraishia capsulata CBS 1993]
MISNWKQKLKDTHITSPFSRSNKSPSKDNTPLSATSSLNPVNSIPSKPPAAYIPGSEYSGSTTYINGDDTEEDENSESAFTNTNEADGESQQETKPEPLEQKLETVATSSATAKSITNDLEKLNITPETITKNLTTTDPVLDESSAQAPVTKSNAKPGLLTVKVYTGNDIRLPISLKITKPVLERLASCGVNIDIPTMESNIDSLLQAANAPSGINTKDLELLVTKSLPALVQVPNPAGDSSVKTPLVYMTVEFDNNTEAIDAIGNTLQNPKFNNVTAFDVSNHLNSMNIQLFIRLPSVLIPDEGKTSEQNQDILVGTAQVNLKSFNVEGTSKRLINHGWISLTNPYTDKNAGFINITIDFKLQEKHSLSIKDFDLLKVIGKGSFGKVMQVRKKDTGKIYALKSIRKAHIVSKMEVTHTLAEKFVLSRVDNPFIVPLKFAFQSNEKLYLVLSFINGGELFYHLQQSRRFSPVRSKFYISELLSAIECLHNLNIIYRDLKPENILLDYQGHIALCDFGLCKMNMKIEQKTNTFCGTPEYLAPELLLNRGYTRVVDFWTLGTLLYEMLTGLPPFYDEDVNKMYSKILNDTLVFPSDMETSTKSLIKGLLTRDPTKRLGYNGTHEIKTHPYFADVDWNKLLVKGYIPPYKPLVKDSTDTSNFDSEFTSERPLDSVVDDFLSESVQKQFGGWTYIGSDTLGQVTRGESFK